MKVLLTGGTGYVGSRLREELKKQGHQVRLLVRTESTHKLPANSYELVQGNIFNTNACLRACDGCDAVVHLIGIIREFPRRGIVFDQFHRVAVQNIVDAARRTGVERLIHMSALGVRENAASNYHRTKFAGEQVVKDSPLRWTIFRPSWIFARRDPLIEQFVDLARRPVVPLINGGKSRFQPVALDDVATCMAKSLRMPETQGRTYEVAGPDRITFRDIIFKVAAQLGRTARTVTVPAVAVRPVVRLMQRFPSFPLTMDQLRMLLEDNVCEIDPYVKTFRLEPQSFVRALPQLLA